MRRLQGGWWQLVFALIGAGAAAVAQEPIVETSPFGSAQFVWQRPGIPAKSACTLWVAYPYAAVDAGVAAKLPMKVQVSEWSGPGYRDHATYLGDLQTRFKGRGARVVVAVAPASALQLAQEQPGFAIAQLGAVADSGPCHCAITFGADPQPVAAWDGLGGVVDHLEAALGNTIDPRFVDADQLADSLLEALGDGGDFADQVAHCMEGLPRSGRARAAALLLEWWCRGDPLAARRVVEQAVADLGNEAVPLCEFADFALRGDRNDPSIPRTLAMVLAPVAAGAPKGVFTQLVYLRALLRAGQDELAARVAAPLQELVVHRPLDSLWFAETLLEGREPRRFRTLAEAAVEVARRGDVDAKLLYAARHKVMVRCGDDGAAIEALVRQYRESPAFGSSLNNDAWYMVTQPLTMGRFDAFACAQAEEMLRLEGAGMDAGNKDTVALVLFLNGRIGTAIELQTAAARARGNDPQYVGRLTRFESTLAMHRAAAKEARDGKERHR